MSFQRSIQENLHFVQSTLRRVANGQWPLATSFRPLCRFMLQRSSEHRLSNLYRTLSIFKSTLTDKYSQNTILERFQRIDNHLLVIAFLFWESKWTDKSDQSIVDAGFFWMSAEESIHRRLSIREEMICF